MTTIKLNLGDEQLTAIDKPIISSGDENVVIVETLFSTDWEGFIRSMVFFVNENEPIEVLLDAENKCNVPNEILANECTFTMGIRGVLNAYKKTSTLLSYKIVKGTPTLDKTLPDITVDLYTQLLNEMVDIREAVANIGSLDDLRESVENISTAITSVTVLLEADNWVGSAAPFTQTVTAYDITSDWIPGVAMVVPPQSTANDDIVAMRSALGCISMIESSAGALTFVCAEDKPTIDITVKVPGVM